MISQEGQVVMQILDSLPVIAVKVGFRFDSSPEERALAEAFMKTYDTWASMTRTEIDSAVGPPQ